MIYSLSLNLQKIWGGGGGRGRTTSISYSEKVCRSSVARLRDSAHFFPIETGQMKNKRRTQRMYLLNSDMRTENEDYYIFKRTSSALIWKINQYKLNSMSLFYHISYVVDFSSETGTHVLQDTRTPDTCRANTVRMYRARLELATSWLQKPSS